MDAVGLTKAHPRLMIFLRQLRATLTGRPYFFNRQKMRLCVFYEIVSKIKFRNFIETGTYLGMTTKFLSTAARKNGAHVYSCEINEEYFEIAKRTVGDLINVHLHRGNSVDFLLGLSPAVADKTNFVYLDAHWYDYLPLKDELSILRDWHNTIVMIDDFKVPFDDGFGWDKYDEDREICMRFVDDVIGDRPMFFPRYPARREGTFARGYCIIPMSDMLVTALEDTHLLKRFEV